MCQWLCIHTSVRGGGDGRFLCVGCQLNENNESLCRSMSRAENQYVCVCVSLCRNETENNGNNRRNIEHINMSEKCMFVRVHIIVSNVQSFHRFVYKYTYKIVYHFNFCISVCAFSTQLPATSLNLLYVATTMQWLLLFLMPPIRCTTFQSKSAIFRNFEKLICQAAVYLCTLWAHCWQWYGQISTHRYICYRSHCRRRHHDISYRLVMNSNNRNLQSHRTHRTIHMGGKNKPFKIHSITVTHSPIIARWFDEQINTTASWFRFLTRYTFALPYRVKEKKTLHFNIESHGVILCLNQRFIYK